MVLRSGSDPAPADWERETIEWMEAQVGGPSVADRLRRAGAWTVGRRTAAGLALWGAGAVLCGTMVLIALPVSLAGLALMAVGLLILQHDL